MKLKTKRQMVEWLNGSEDGTEIHAPLVRMVCVFENFGEYEETTEVVFAVTIDWLCGYKQKVDGREWSWWDIEDWLKNKYTSEDSQQILEAALAERQIAFWKIN